MRDYPTLKQIQAVKEKLGSLIVETPAHPWRDPRLSDRIGHNTEVFVKLELLQVTGTFKPRGALNVMLNLDKNELRRGVTAVSAGNHAIATAYASKALGTTAKVVMPKNANPLRMRMAQDLGAEIDLVDSPHNAFARVQQIEREEGRTFIHPFEGVTTATGTGTIGLEIWEQLEDVDTIIVAIGGGGLCAGIASVVKQLKSDCTIIGVEPEGAASMHRSFETREAAKLEEIMTIADSLAAPFALPYSFEICHRYVDELVMITDEEIRDAMGLLFREMKIAVEPACAAATAALVGPLRNRFRSGKVLLVFCGSNIDGPSFSKLARLT